MGWLIEYVANCSYRCGSEQDIPICVYTSSVRAPINCGVALRSSARRASSTNWPIEYQSADLRRYKAAIVSKSQHSTAKGPWVVLTSSRSAASPSTEAMAMYKCICASLQCRGLA